MRKTKYTVKYTTGFKKDYKRAIKRGLKIELLEQDYNTVGSFTAAALLTLMAIITLFLKSMLQWRLENQEKRAQQEEHHEH